MLVDKFGRKIAQLRISVTDRCNYRCTYCMPAEGVKWKPHADILSYEEITAIVREAVRLGIKRVRLTGGEPLVRKNIEAVIGQIAEIPGLEDLSMTTNGSLLTVEKAQLLKKAGLMRVNISLDSLDPARFSALTRGGVLADVLRGIDAARAAKLDPIKINMVLFDETTPQEIETMRAFCSKKGLQLQTISHFSLNDRQSGSARSADRPRGCDTCDRLRLTADGFIKPCLFSNDEIKAGTNDINGAFLKATSLRPQSGAFCTARSMVQIGG